MRFVKYLAIVLAGIFVFAACQKEFSLERGDFAAGSLKDTTGSCLPITVQGTYTVDSTLADTNFITAQVRFSSPGNYTISTDSVNGFFFHGSGSVKDAGLQSIRLTGSGKPILAQTTNFVVAFDTSACMVSVPVAGSSAGPQAVYTLAGAPNGCANANVEGSYDEGSPLNAANSVTIEVNVDSTGSYSITAGPANGMTFSTQGEFLSTGLQTVTLQGIGTPTAAGSTTVPVNAGGTSCSFTVTVNAGTTPAEDSAWQFSEGDKFYHGFIDTAFTQRFETENGDTATALSFYGSSDPGTDTLFQLDILLPGNTIETGIYNTDSANADFYLYNIDTTIRPPYYQADFEITPSVNIQINITNYDPVTKIVTATFSGTARNQAGQTVNITGGKIYAKVD